ncbi:MAG TPA: 16S rRNA (guanine(527)-N(7))-methyltransferase RsmG [Polyangia bacterium]|nr:16S rRNA (guanine(527)-N(7))-methyltransferase RsmG [Polyangia bacterium]
MADRPESIAPAIARLAEAWGVSCDDAQTEALERFAALLLQWNERINLTGASSPSMLADEHFPDSFALAARFEADSSIRAVDVGSGGGLPAIPLAILRPSLRIRLVEPIAKKAAFLRTATRELSLRPRVDVHVGRAEAMGATPFDAALSRATFAPGEWAEIGRKLVLPEGRIFVLASVADEGFALPVTTRETFRQRYLDGRRTIVELTAAPISL